VQRAASQEEIVRGHGCGRPAGLLRAKVFVSRGRGGRCTRSRVVPNAGANVSRACKCWSLHACGGRAEDVGGGVGDSDSDSDSAYGGGQGRASAEGRVS
jgi:hypothetical protein